MALARLKRYREAVRCFGKAIVLKPDSAVLRIGKGIMLTKLGDFREAVRCFDEAIGLSPLDPNAHIQKALALEKLGAAPRPSNSAGMWIGKALESHSRANPKSS